MNKKSIFSLVLSFMMIFCLIVPSSALEIGETADIAGVYESGRAVIIGKAADYADKLISVLLLGGDGSDTSLSNILFVDNVRADSKGYYEVKLKYNGFEITDGVVSNCTLRVKAEDKDITDTVISATVKKSDMLAVELKTSLGDNAKAIAEVNNLYGENLDVTVMIAAYDDNNKLIGVVSADEIISDEEAEVVVTYENMPEKFSRLVAFVWDSATSLIPYTQQKDVEYADNNIKTVVIHPGADESERRFTWYNDQLTYGAKLQYALKADYEADGGFTSENSVVVTGTTEIPYANTTDVSCKAEISNLLPDTEYVYRLGNKYKYDETVYSFKTYNPNNSDKQTFAMITDLHNGGKSYFDPTAESYAASRTKYISNTLESMLLQYPDIEFMVSTGDNVSHGNMDYSQDAENEFYLLNAEAEMEDLFTPDIFKRVPFASTLGNHEMHYSRGEYGSVTKYHYNLPNDDGSCASTMGNTHGNFWFRNGDVLIVGIHATAQTHREIMVNTTAEKNKAYIEAAINANTDAKWRILVNHVPPYSFTGGATEISNMRQVFADMDIDQYEFDVVFTGHQHTYSRSKQLLTDGDANSATYGSYNFIQPEVVSEDKITHSADANGYQLDTATNPEGAVHINLPSVTVSGGSSILPDYASYLESYGTPNSSVSSYKYAHDSSAVSGVTPIMCENLCYTVVSVENTSSGSQMKIELVQSNATKNNTSSEGTVLDTYIINKTN